MSPYQGNIQERKHKKQIHQRSGSGDENLITAAAGIGSAVVGTFQTQPELPHRNSKHDCGQHVTHLVEQQAGYERGSECEAKPQSGKADANEDAHGKQKPSCIVHPERNHKHAHACTFAQPLAGAMRTLAHQASFIAQDEQALIIPIL
ncbi:MAG: hypothetical protein ABR928_16465 [Terracidiphilus sp.]|jgi:hypothetical protein